MSRILIANLRGAQGPQGIAGAGGPAADAATATYVVGPSATNTALLGMFGHLFTPEAYGAVGDGTTDDTTAIVAAYTAAALVAGTVRFAPTTYVASAVIDPTGTTTDGYGATLKTKAGITQTFGTFTATSAFTMRGLTINLNKANTTDPGVNTQGMGIYVLNTAGWAGTVGLKDVTIINGWQIGVRLQTNSTITDATTCPVSRAQIDNLRVDACDVGAFDYFTNGVTYVNPNVTNSGHDGISDYGSLNTEIIGGRVSVAGRHCVVYQYSYGFAITGASIGTATVTGIVVGGGSATMASCRNFTIANNRVKGCSGSGIQVDPTIATGVVVPTYATVTGNICDGNTIHGIYLHNNQFTTVTGNLCRGNGNAGLAFDSQNLTISGNILTGNLVGMNFQGTTGTYGYHEVGRNIVTGNTSQNYVFGTVGATGVGLDLTGQGTPQGVVAAPVGSRFMRTDGGTTTTLYVKETGTTTSSGWVAK